MAAKLAICPNCDEALATAPNFCPTCGQENVETRGDWAEVLRELLKTVVRIDGKILRTVVAVVAKPGLVSEEYSAGKRSRWVSPVKAFLLASTLYFALALAVGVDSHARASFEMGVAAGEGSSTSATSDVATRLAKIDEEMKKIEAADMPGFVKRGVLGGGVLQRAQLRNDTAVQRRFGAAMVESSKWVMALLVPFAALLMRIFGKRPRRFYVDAFVFVLYAQAADCLLSIPSLAVGRFAPSWTATLAGSAPWVVWMYFAARRFWGTSWLSTALRLLPLWVLYIIAFGVVIMPLTFWQLGKLN